MNSGYEVIMCIINAGYSELVMDAAKEVGAGGGTVIHARGTANQEAEKFFQITIQPDKDIVMILVPSQIKDDVLHAVYQSAGLKTAGQGIAFSMPVDSVVGLSAAAATRVKESKPQEAATDEIAPTQEEAEAETAPTEEEGEN
ncbi:MAG: P-II family nitrogen regulator [Clostridiales bacterium]|nr:P-II family nitrogen regulator [Clostridiales bacterium]